MEAVGILARQSKSVDYLMAALMYMSSYELSTKGKHQNAVVTAADQLRP